MTDTRVAQRTVGRPKTSKPTKNRRSISVTDTEWQDVQTIAQKLGKSASQVLLLTVMEKYSYLIDGWEY